MNWPILVLGLIALAFGLFSFWKAKTLERQIQKKEAETNRRLYELAILKELGERIGYSLNIQQIAEIITGSLRQFIDYSLVSYILLGPEKILFRANLEKSVNHDFVAEVKKRMLTALEALLDKDFRSLPVEEVLSGAILVDELKEPVGSFFNIPLVISEKVVGMLTVAHAQTGLYREEEMTILYKIVRQASQAVTRLQEVVEIEQRKLNSMIKSMADGVVMTDKDLRLIVANPAASQAIGFQGRAEIEIFDFIEALEGKFDLRSRLEESMTHRRLLEPVEIKLNQRFFQIFVFPVTAAAGLNPEEVLGGVVIFHDITREKEVAQIKEDFISMIVHELRSPMDGIKKISSSMMRWDQTKSGQLTAKYAGMINQTVVNVLELVSDLLDAAKLEAGKFELKIVPADLTEIIEERVNFFEASAKENQLTLQAEISSSFPALVSLDSARIAQVLNNLLSNALKFTNSGGAITIKALLHQTGKDLANEWLTANWQLKIKDQLIVDKISALPNSVVVMVEDTGMGIPKESREAVFDKFKQLNLPAVINVQKGTGLGLVIAQGIVEEHGGTVGVDSEEGEGSVFYFTLPLKEEVS